MASRLLRPITIPGRRIVICLATITTVMGTGLGATALRHLSILPPGHRHRICWRRAVGVVDRTAVLPPTHRTRLVFEVRTTMSIITRGRSVAAVNDGTTCIRRSTCFSLCSGRNICAWAVVSVVAMGVVVP
uniref:Putative secreted protein n=1 Tax=Anopheles darlingi TaxID=43151 RepID=A0A2M4DFQ1_ANODA